MVKKLNISIKGKLTKTNGTFFKVSDKKDLLDEFETFINARDWNFAGDVEIIPIN